MPRTSTAERHNYICPLCAQPLARDHESLGWVRHTARADVEQILADPAKAAMMNESDRDYLQFQGLCPFERGQKDDVEPPPPRFAYLGPRQGSNYRQWFVKGTRIRAEVLHLATLDPERRPPKEVAEDYQVPIEAVLEAVEYCEQNEELLRQECEEDWADIRARGLDRRPIVHAAPDADR